VSNLPRPITDTLDRINIRNGPSESRAGQEPTAKDETCLLPPLTLINSPTIAAEQLEVAAKAKKEYHEACIALKKKRGADAEKHLRKAAQHYPKYSAAWVTLGQVLAAQQRTEEAHSACLEGSIADPSYVPAYLCLADIAAHAQAWGEVLKMSGRALELDPSHDALAYEYHAAANLSLHNLAAAEKSGLRALEIDRDHREPRVHFVLAQIYEAKGDSANEATQLREYLRYADSPDDVAIVQQYLSKLEKESGTGKAVGNLSGGSATGVAWLSTRRWGPADIDEVVPPVRTTSCPLPQILKETSKRTQDLIENLQRFSASERIEQIDIGKTGKSRTTTSEVLNYVAQIEENSSGYPAIKEYRSGPSGIRRASLVDTGAAAFALIFHPTHIRHFDFRCEGLTELPGTPAWQVHFEESADPAQPFQAIQIGGSLYLPRLKGRAWIGTDRYDVVRLETDLVAPIPQIDLQLEHQVITYAPVEFQEHHIRLWLPQSTSLHMAYHGHRYQRIHNFSQFQLFSVDATPVVKEPATNQLVSSVSRMQH
jgi:tetratricopeptide (TPR) repeat protein